MNFKYSLLTVLLCSTFQAYAADTPQMLSTKAEQDIRDNLDNLYRIGDQSREKAAWDMYQKQEKTVSDQHNQASETEHGECLNYSGIVLKGITLIDQHALEARIPSCINQNSLNQLNKDIVAAYIKQGYPITQINFETTADKQLLLNVSEGKIREITGQSRSVNIGTLFPAHQNRPLNIHYLDQGIEQANSVTGNHVSMDIYPHNDGTASIELRNDKQKSWEGSIIVDNKGSKPNTAMVRGNLNIGSPFALSDSLYLNAYSNLNNHDSQYTRGGNFLYRLPYGAWTFNLYGATAKSQNILKFDAGNTRFAYRSQSDMAGIKAERMLYRGQKHLTSAYLSADYLNIKTTFGGSSLNLQSPKIRSVSTGLSHTRILPSGIWLNSIGIEKGHADHTENTPFDKHYSLFSLQSNLIQNRKSGNWTIRNHHQLYAQYSPDDLFATKELDIVGYHYLRGFRSFSMSANRAAVLSNTLYFRRHLNSRTYIEPYIGADIGFAKDAEGTQRGESLVTGLNIGQYDRWQLSTDLAYGFAHTDNPNTEKQDHVTISLRIPF